MISEVDFASRYTSFWHQCMPWGEELVKTINGHLAEKFYEPRNDFGERQDLVGELGLRWFAARLSNGRISIVPSVNQLREIGYECASYIAQLRHDSSINPPSPLEAKEAKADANALIQFILAKERESILLPFPQFHGCGILDACKGDLLAGATLYEVKAISRGFLQPHLRQLIVYCALNFAKPTYDIRSVGLINPRRGIFFVEDLNILTTRFFGKTPTTLFNEIIDFLSAPSVST